MSGSCFFCFCFVFFSYSLICVCRNMRIRDQEDLFLSKASPKTTPAANRCVCGSCVCTVTTIRTGMKGFCVSQVLQRSSSAQSRWVDFFYKNKKKSVWLMVLRHQHHQQQTKLNSHFCCRIFFFSLSLSFFVCFIVIITYYP